MTKRRTCLVILLGALPAAAWAQSPAGPEFLVNTFTTSDQGRYLSLAMDAGGNFVAAWSSLNQDGSSHGVFGQRFSVSGALLGAEFRVNTYTSSDQREPSIATGANGDFVVVWTSLNQDGWDFGVFGQRFSASGAPVGAEFQVNTYTTDDQSGPSVASDDDGNFVVAWSSRLGQDGSGWGVFGQRFDASGAPAGAEFQVNTYTTLDQRYPSVASDASGNFVVVWNSLNQDGSSYGVFGQRFGASGAPVGAEFRVNTFTPNPQADPSVASDASGNFVVAWSSLGQDASATGVFAQRFSASGAPVGAEFRVNTFTLNSQGGPSVTSDDDGDFVVAWTSANQDTSGFGVFAQRFSGAGTPVGAEFRVNTYTLNNQLDPSVALDANANFVVVWKSFLQDGSAYGVFGQRFGGLRPAALAADTASTGTSDGNGLFEPGEGVTVAASWSNFTGEELFFGGRASNFTGPAGATYTIVEDTAVYGLGDGETGPCAACYTLAASAPAVRPVLHWDTEFTETLLPVSVLAQYKRWRLHLGDSFTDVPRANGFYRFVETLLHHSVTGGCASNTYCPDSSTTRAQMAVFVLVAREGPGYAPPACAPPNIFDDVPETSPFCRWIEELAKRGVVGGCGGGNYCPGDPVSREQMAVFVLSTLDPALDPPACVPPNIFGDVPETSPFCRWIEELANRAVVTGCGGGNYCPTNPVTRAQMGVFISRGFGLLLYGP